MSIDKHIEVVEKHLEVVGNLARGRDPHTGAVYNHEQLRDYWDKVDESLPNAVTAMKVLARKSPDEFAKRMRIKQLLYNSACRNGGHDYRSKFDRALSDIGEYQLALFRLSQMPKQYRDALTPLLDHLSDGHRESLEHLFVDVKCMETLNMLIELGQRAKEVNGGSLDYYARLLAHPLQKQRFTNPKDPAYGLRKQLISYLASVIESADNFKEMFSNL